MEVPAAVVSLSKMYLKPTWNVPRLRTSEVPYVAVDGSLYLIWCLIHPGQRQFQTKSVAPDVGSSSSLPASCKRLRDDKLSRRPFNVCCPLTSDLF
ncbi:hypothetical protein VTK73DRAFT_6962 [Phialemonium thermophilum]|uniref:Uncharacterized protein n=1 Tax=Phialemonium thermophilum TaxID=223376 RepID=A0ABR3XTW5_9PEZI